MRLCFAALDYPAAQSGGGVGNQVRLLGQALVKAGHQVTVIALGQPGGPQRITDGEVCVDFVRLSNIYWLFFGKRG